MSAKRNHLKAVNSTFEEAAGPDESGPKPLVVCREEAAFPVSNLDLANAKAPPKSGEVAYPSFDEAACLTDTGKR